jgi:hypothetical protein
MKKFGLLFLGLIGGILLTLAFFSTGATRNSLAQSSGTKRPIGVTATPHLSDKSVSAETPSMIAGSDELPPANRNAEMLSPNALPTPIPGETLAYFVPTDSDATATVLVLYNTDSVSAGLYPSKSC